MNNLREIDCLPFSNYFTNAVRKKLHIDDSFPLEKLHETLSAEEKKYNIDDGVNAISESLYEMDEDFYHHYHDFIRELKTQFDFPFYFQAIPTIRIQTPDSENAN